MLNYRNFSVCISIYFRIVNNFFFLHIQYALVKVWIRNRGLLSSPQNTRQLFHQICIKSKSWRTSGALFWCVVEEWYIQVIDYLLCAISTAASSWKKKRRSKWAVKMRNLSMKRASFILLLSFPSISLSCSLCRRRLAAFIWDWQQ